MILLVQALWDRGLWVIGGNLLGSLYWCGWNVATDPTRISVNINEPVEDFKTFELIGGEQRKTDESWTYYFCHCSNQITNSMVPRIYTDSTK